MKKFLSIFLVFFCLMSIVACSGGGSSTSGTTASTGTSSKTEQTTSGITSSNTTNTTGTTVTPGDNEKPSNALSIVNSATISEGWLSTGITKYDAKGRILSIELSAAGEWGEGVSFTFKYSGDNLSQITVYEDYLPSDREAYLIAYMKKDGNKYVSDIVYGGDNVAFKTKAEKVEAEFWENGVLKALTTYQNDEKIYYFEYDEEGRLIKSSFADEGISILSLSDDKKSGTISYTENGEIVVTATVQFDGVSVKNIVSDEFNIDIELTSTEKNNTIKVSTFGKGEDSNFSITNTYIYDENMLLSEFKVIMSEGEDSESYTMKYKYDNNGLLAEYSAFMYDEQGNEVPALSGGVIAYTYDYNDKGLLISINKGTSTYTYDYDENGNLIKETYISTWSKSITTYIQNDKITKKIEDYTSYEDGIISYRTVTETEYDDMFNIIKETITEYDKDGNILDIQVDNYKN